MNQGIPQWPAPSAADFVDALLLWLERDGATHYDEVVSQLEHALQTAHLAVRAGDTDSAVAAALLHDVGHLLLADQHRPDAPPDTDLEHETVGARWLAQMFPDEVTAPIRAHVHAKRYLCTVDQAYLDRLSEASRHSFELQGGPMTTGELAAAEKLPRFDAALALRRRDDGAKVTGRKVPDLGHYRDLLESLVRM